MRAWVAIGALPGMTPRRFALLLHRFGTAAAAWAAGGESLARVAGLNGAAAAHLAGERARSDPDALWQKISGFGWGVVTWGMAGYPRLLQSIPDAPPVLYVLGSLAGEDERMVAVVGSRRPDHTGLHVAERLAMDLAAAGVTVVSGMARGIDAAAHLGALRGGGRTIAVLGSSLDMLYPWEHRSLAGRIARQGAVISEFPPGTPPSRWNFPRRNRIISGLCRAVVVVSAGERSGALHTVNHAIEQGREVLAVPGDVTRPQAAGSNRLIRDGAGVVLSASDVLHTLGWGVAKGCVAGNPSATAAPAASAARGDIRAEVDLPDIEKKVYLVLSPEPETVEKLSERAGLPVGTVNSMLLMLQLRGLARRLPGPLYMQPPGRSV